MLFLFYGIGQKGYGLTASKLWCWDANISLFNAKSTLLIIILTFHRLNSPV